MESLKILFNEHIRIEEKNNMIFICINSSKIIGSLQLHELNSIMELFNDKMIEISFDSYI